MPLIYALIARPPGSTLVDGTNPAHTGNFPSIALKILANMPPAQTADKAKVTFVFEGHTFNFRSEQGLVFMCMCDEAYGRSKPFVFLKDIIDTYFLMFSGDETVLEGSTARSFKGVLTQKIKSYSEPTPGSSESGGSLSSSLSTSVDADAKIAKMQHVKAELDSLASSAKAGIDKVLSRGEAIESLVDRTGQLHTSGDMFRKRSKKLNQRLCMENLKLKLFIALVVMVGLYLLLAVYCDGLRLPSCRV